MQEQNIINEITVLDQEGEDIGEDLGSTASVEDETADEPEQEIPDMTVLDQEDEDLDEDSGSVDSVEDETADEPEQVFSDITDLSPSEAQEIVQKESGNTTLVQNLMKVKGIVPDTESEAQRSQSPDPSSPPEIVHRMEITIDDEIF